MGSWIPSCHGDLDRRDESSQVGVDGRDENDEIRNDFHLQTKVVRVTKVATLPELGDTVQQAADAATFHYTYRSLSFQKALTLPHEVIFSQFY